jgi:hypothetical protein
VQVSYMATALPLTRLLQDLSTTSASTGSDPYVMADGGASAISPAIPARARSASAADSAGYIAGVAIAVVLALAVLVILFIIMCRKRNSSLSAQPPAKIIVRFGFDSCFQVAKQVHLALLYTRVLICSVETEEK